MAARSTVPLTLYVYDLDDHLIAEVNTSGQTLKEYIWLDDIPVAVVDGVKALPSGSMDSVNAAGRQRDLMRASWGGGSISVP